MEATIESGEQPTPRTVKDLAAISNAQHKLVRDEIAVLTERVMVLTLKLQATAAKVAELQARPAVTPQASRPGAPRTNPARQAPPPAVPGVSQLSDKPYGRIVCPSHGQGGSNMHGQCIPCCRLVQQGSERNQQEAAA